MSRGEKIDRLKQLVHSFLLKVAPVDPSLNPHEHSFVQQMLTGQHRQLYVYGWLKLYILTTESLCCAKTFSPTHLYRQPKLNIIKNTFRRNKTM